MKVYIPDAQNLSAAMKRVETNLERYRPERWIRVQHQEDADFVIFHVIGYPDTLEALQKLGPKQYPVLIQYCVKSTQQSSVRSWYQVWRNCAMVWSYYNLYSELNDVGIVPKTEFYLSPLGVDPEIFQPHPARMERQYTILTSGYVAESECAREAAEATRQLGKKQFHLGPELGLGGHVVQWHGIQDKTLAEVYRNCYYVAGLRRCEGFELPAAEGLLCGSRPIVFDQPHYRRWYRDWAFYIKEEGPEGVTEALKRVFSGPYRPVTSTELEEARAQFSWQGIIKGFWDSLERAL